VKTAQCRSKFKYESKFTAASRGSPSDSTAVLLLFIVKQTFAESNVGGWKQWTLTCLFDGFVVLLRLSLACRW